MDAGFITLNPRDQRIPAAAPDQAMPLKPDPAHMKWPDVQKPMLMEDGKTPKSFEPTFKDIYLHKREELRKSAEGMEAMLVRQVMKAMRSTLPQPEEDEDLFGSASHATQMFTQMMDDSLSDKIASNGDFGIADKIFKSQVNTITQEFVDQLAQAQPGQDRPFGLPLNRR